MFGTIGNSVAAVIGPLAFGGAQIFYAGAVDTGGHIRCTFIAFFERLQWDAVAAVIGECTVVVATAISADVGFSKVAFFVVAFYAVAAVFGVLALGGALFCAVIGSGWDVISAIIAHFVWCGYDAIAADACKSRAILLAVAAIGICAAAHDFAQTFVAFFVVADVAVAAVRRKHTIRSTTAIGTEVGVQSIIAFLAAVDDGIAAESAFRISRAV